jgi:DNA-binding response OmpR family regulator
MSKKRVLMIDDETMFVEMIKMRLEATNHCEVLTAYNEREGLEMARREKPDLIILDVMLSKLNDGYKLCQTLKSDIKYQHIPIVMLTARDRDPDIEKGTQVGADGYLTKPCGASELSAMLGKYLDVRHTA